VDECQPLPAGDVALDAPPQRKTGGARVGKYGRYGRTVQVEA